MTTLAAVITAFRVQDMPAIVLVMAIVMDIGTFSLGYLLGRALK